MSKPIIIVCECDKPKVKKFGEFVPMPPTVQQALDSGTYRRQFEKCPECKLKIGASNRLIPVKDR